MFKVFPRHTVHLTNYSLVLLLGTFLNVVRKKRNYIKEFENDFAQYIGAKYTFGVSSGRVALYLILDALNFKEGTEIIISDYNFPPVPLILKQYGLRPVFVDVHPESHNLDVSLVEEKITPRTGAILVTHLFGQPCKMDVILDIAQRRGIKVIEDCAHACGSEYKGKKVGSFGDVAYFSFGPGKNLPCFGGGMLVTNDESIAKELKGLYEKLASLPFLKTCKFIKRTAMLYVATHKMIFPYTLYPAIYFLSLFNSDLIDNLLKERIEACFLPLNNKYKIANLQARTGLFQLKYIDENNKKRIDNACILNNELKAINEIEVVKPISEAKNIYLYYQLLVEDRENFRKKLLRRGIDTKKNDIHTCSLLAIFKNDKQRCPVSKELSLKSLEIPCSSFMTKEDILYIAKQIKETYQGQN
ncbi:MAG: DegT/DnrJ/EryC1/StrS family aminotransferase [Candidatus Omnitrophica bacterium]|nr:DegT/DnrJ/EryC1/StrS family aminotransferase [Candidatus Omnitrophota bacterium]